VGEQGAVLQDLLNVALVQPVVAVPLEVTHVPAHIYLDFTKTAFHHWNYESRDCDRTNANEPLVHKLIFS